MTTATDRWRRWVDHPQRAPGRKAVFQVHLWLAIALAVYVLAISASGSAVVFRRELGRWLVPTAVPSTSGARLTGEALRAAIERAYPGYEIADISDDPGSARPAQVTRRRNGRRSDRLFDPYAGADMGDAVPLGVRVLEWLVDFHDNLAAGRVGRRVNGIASALVGVLIASGAILWWPGRRRWPASLLVPRPSKTRRFAWHLHSAVGFWSFALLAIWVVTGIYFAFPGLFDAFVASGSRVDGAYVAAPGEKLLLEMIDLHFGRFGGLGVRVGWTLLGLLPAVLLVTGLIVWWRRVVRPALAHRASRRVLRQHRGDVALRNLPDRDPSQLLEGVEVDDGHIV